MSDHNSDRAKLAPVAPGSGGAKAQPSTALNSLTGLRFIAAIGTFLFHATLMVNPLNFSWPMITPFADDSVAQRVSELFSYSGFVGLSFFFVLSGFVLTWSARPGSSVRTFYRRRLAKVFPNHLVMWVLAMLLFAGGVVTWRVWLPNLFLVQAWFPDFKISQAMNVPAWSLCAELFFYLCFPLLLRPISRLSTRGLWIGAGAMVAGLAVYQVALMTIIPGKTTPGPPLLADLQYWLGYLFPAGRLFEFVLGMFVARIVLARKWIRVGPLLATVILAVSYVVTLFVPANFALNLVTLAPIGLVVGAFANADLEGKRTMLRGRVMVFLGKISFAFYLVQMVTVFYFRAVTGGARYSVPVGILVLLGLFAMSILGGWLLFRFVETPAMRWWGRKRDKPVALAPAPGDDPASRDVGGERRAA
ncbi:acyltransferase family protein [Amycolatopsis samaneae]|uniref:Acyltransferase family protein n=1 Tax=Amycolatopsis samaneae TaxID=664691 RepID=A0ABW5GTH7_9PSEU